MRSHLTSFLGITGIAILWLSVSTSLILTDFDVLGQLPISYLGVFESSKYVFNSGLIVASVLLVLFMRQLSKEFSLSWLFKVVFLLGQVCQIIVALTPYNSTSIGRPVHVVSAFLLAFTLPLSMYLFKKSTGVAEELKDITGTLLKLELLTFGTGITWFVLASSAGALAEIVTAIVFDIWIVAISARMIKSRELGYS